MWCHQKSRSTFLIKLRLYRVRRRRTWTECISNKQVITKNSKSEINTLPQSKLPKSEDFELEYFEVTESSLCNKSITNKNSMNDYVVQALSSKNTSRVEEILRNPLIKGWHAIIETSLVRPTGMAHNPQVGNPYKELGALWSKLPEDSGGNTARMQASQDGNQNRKIKP